MTADRSSVSLLTAENKSALIAFVQAAVRTCSYSDEEEEMAKLVLQQMQTLGYDEAFIDQTGNVVGIMRGPVDPGTAGKTIHFDSHMDTVRVTDADEWKVPPFSGEIADGFLWGRGSVDMKSGLCSSVFAAALAKQKGLLRNKTVYVTGTVCEEFCDGENLSHLYKELDLKPDCCIICEPSGNIITLGHKGKAQILITTHGVSAHGSAPEKGVNAVYEMAEIISRVEALNKRLSERPAPHGTVVLSDISCVSASLNAVPSECSIYLDRRLAIDENLSQVKKEMDELIAGKNADWQPGTLRHTSWKGSQLIYEPLHDPWQIERDHPLTQAMNRAWAAVCGQPPKEYNFWDFGTNAITPVAMGVPTIGFGPGEYKLAHMRDENCSVKQIIEACRVYIQLLAEL